MGFEIWFGEVEVEVDTSESPLCRRQHACERFTVDVKLAYSLHQMVELSNTPLVLVKPCM